MWDGESEIRKCYKIGECGIKKLKAEGSKLKERSVIRLLSY